MTEYDYSSEGLDPYRTTQDRISQWSGSQRYPSQHGFVPSSAGDRGAFAAGLPYDDRNNSIYGQERRHHRRGRSTTRRPLNGSYQNQGREEYYPDPYNAGQNPTLTSFHNPGTAGSVQYPLGSLNAQMNQPYFPSSRSYDNRYAYDRSAPVDPYHNPSSRHHYSRSRGRYPSSHIQLPHSMRHSSRSRSSSRYSYSSRSYSSRSRSYSPSRRSHRDYRTVHASPNSPTVIQPSRDYPTVVPINGGVGGYVVVPAAGQSLQVVNPRKDSSLLGRILSPSKWRINLRKKYY